MTRVTGPLARFIHYDDGKNQLAIRSGGRPTSDPNGALLLRRVAWTEVDPKQKEGAEAALRATAAKSLLPLSLLAAAHRRRDAAVERLKARNIACLELRVRPVWKVVVGLGEETPAETGMRLHGTYGTPVLPGSALKGAARATARTDEANYRDYGRDTFGNEVGEDRRNQRTGTSAFLDALPLAPDRSSEPIPVDVMNPHVPRYYRSGGQTPPAEYEQPVPVQFLTVSSEVSFRIHIVGCGSDADLAEITADEARRWLAAALAGRGIGAKTSAGYGYLVEESV